MSETEQTFECDTCDRTVSYDETRRIETIGGLDPAKWQTFCCPNCGARLKTVFVAMEDSDTKTG